MVETSKQLGYIMTPKFSQCNNHHDGLRGKLYIGMLKNVLCDAEVGKFCLTFILKHLSFDGSVLFCVDIAPIHERLNGFIGMKIICQGVQRSGKALTAEIPGPNLGASDEWVKCTILFG